MKNNPNDLTSITEFVDEIDARLKLLNAKIVGYPSQSSNVTECILNVEERVVSMNYSVPDNYVGEQKCEQETNADPEVEQGKNAKVVRKSNAKLKIDRHIKKIVSTDIVVGGKSTINLNRQVSEIKENSTEIDDIKPNEDKENAAAENINSIVTDTNPHGDDFTADAITDSSIPLQEPVKPDILMSSTLDDSNNVPKSRKPSVGRCHTFTAGNIDKQAYLESQSNSDFTNLVNTHSTPAFCSNESVKIQGEEKFNLLKEQKGLTNIDAKEEKRRAIILQLYKTEKSYVDSLRNLVMKYYLPLKEKTIISDASLNDIFYKIPEIHIHHQLLLNAYKKKLESWDNTETIADTLISVFKKSTIADTYIGFVNNFSKAQTVLKNCKEISAFAKFTEHQAKSHEGKLTISDLIIQPIQRIPRYELFLKDLLKCTNTDHPDYKLIENALVEVHRLAENIDKAKDKLISNNEEAADESMIKDIMEGIQDTYKDSVCVRHAALGVSIDGEKKKPHYVFLFSDCLMITCKKKRPNLLPRKADEIITTTIENLQVFNKHIVKVKESLEKIVILKEVPRKTYETYVRKTALSEDNAILTDIQLQMSRLNYASQDILDAINRTIVRNEVCIYKADEEVTGSIDDICHMEISILHSEKTCPIGIWFNSPQQRLDWEDDIKKLKRVKYERKQGISYSFEGKIDLCQPNENFKVVSSLITPCSYSDKGLLWILLKSDKKSTIIKTVTWRNEISYIQSKTLENTMLRGMIFIDIFSENLNVRTRKNDIALNENNHELSVVKYVPQETIGSIRSVLECDLISRISGQQSVIYGPSLWCVNEDGSLVIICFNNRNPSLDTVTHYVQKMMPHSIQCLLFVKERVFCGAKNGHIITFKRGDDVWDVEKYDVDLISKTSLSVKHICSVYDQLWCSIGRQIFILSPETRETKHVYELDTKAEEVLLIEHGKNSFDCVLIIPVNYTEIFLFQPKSYNLMGFISLNSISMNVMINTDFKSTENLYITTIAAMNDSLWIGTSFGLTFSVIPFVTDEERVNTHLCDSLKGMEYGHSGSVVQIVPSLHLQSKKQFVYTIGSGFQDFRNFNSSRDTDLSNTVVYLLMWKSKI